MALAMALLGCLIWAVLHFGFARRLTRLAQSVEAFGHGQATVPETLPGGDEVAALSTKFAAMAQRLRERETEQVRLEREVLEISDNERRRIGHDVHDSLGQRLTAAALATNALAGSLRTDAPALASQADEIGRELRDAITEARSISHGLAPVDLIDDGLMTALGRLAEDTSRASNIRCIFECEPAVCVTNPKISGHLYRIAQEAVANALKHASASEIRIGLECRDGSTYCSRSKMTEKDSTMQLCTGERYWTSRNGISCPDDRRIVSKSAPLRPEGREFHRWSRFQHDDRENKGGIEIPHLVGGRSSVCSSWLSADARGGIGPNRLWYGHKRRRGHQRGRAVGNPIWLLPILLCPVEAVSIWSRI